MKYYALKSVVSSQKGTFTLAKGSTSFGLCNSRIERYIEPSLSKDFPPDCEKPSVILIAAIGATGKSALAHALSYDCKLPLLDLAKHKTVGDNTLTGLLTNSYATSDISSIFEGLRQGTFGVVIDGVDEGRSKTNEKGFEAFLDDIALRCEGATATSFVLLGRTQTIDDCWVYLIDKNVSVGQLSIEPFNMDQAKEYIDLITKGDESGQRAQYHEARDGILQKLSSAFDGTAGDADADLALFIGYPPVLRKKLQPNGG